MNDPRKERIKSHFVHILQFLALEPSDQIAYCGAALPDDASDWLPASSDSDDKRYELRYRAQEGNPFLRLKLEYNDFKNLVFRKDNYPLPEPLQVVDEVKARMKSMIHYPENAHGQNRHWGKNQLINDTEWRELRELSRRALRGMNARPGIPGEPFVNLLYVE